MGSWTCERESLILATLRRSSAIGVTHGVYAHEIRSYLVAR